jgi:hypothetical protein
LGRRSRRNALLVAAGAHGAGPGREFRNVRRLFADDGGEPVDDANGRLLLRRIRRPVRVIVLIAAISIRARAHS